MRLRLLIVFFALLLAAGAAPAQVTTAVALDSVTNTDGDTAFLAGETHYISIRLTNLGSGIAYNPSNGFHLFSEDGAQWSYPLRDTTFDTTIVEFPPPPDTTIDTIVDSILVFEPYLTLFDNHYVNWFSGDGAGADTIGTVGIVGGPSSPGLVDGLDIVVYWFPILSRPEDVGRHICIDSAWYPPGGTWKWAPLGAGEQIFPDWSGQKCWQIITPTAVDERRGPQLPNEFGLAQNYPNPFNPTTHIKFDVPYRSEVTLTIYNVLGQRVITLVDRELEAGFHEVPWDGRSAGGRSAASGIYFYRLEADSYVKTKKMMLIK